MPSLVQHRKALPLHQGRIKEFITYLPNQGKYKLMRLHEHLRQLFIGLCLNDIIASYTFKWKSRIFSDQNNLNVYDDTCAWGVCTASLVLLKFMSAQKKPKA